MPVATHLLLTALFAVIMPSMSFPIRNDMEAGLFLQKYGYLEDMPGAAGNISENPHTFTKALVEFQAFVGLSQTVTGELDDETLTMMNTPRCGIKDKLGPLTSVRRKRYALQGSKWKKTHLTYRISKYPKQLKDRVQTDTEISRALKVWRDVTPLTFEERRRGRVKIDIRFEEREHGDEEPFDGPGTSLAHAFFPQFGGDVHFDGVGKWIIDGGAGPNLFQVAAHEFGHSLGLAHSNNTKALMYPYFRTYEQPFKLHPDDITAIQTLYGSNENNVRNMTKEDEEDFGPLRNVSYVADLCQNGSIDTITKTQDGNTYAFKGDFYWKIFPKSLDSIQPKRISKDWEGLPGNLDASLTWSTGKTYFFKDKSYWRFTNREMDLGFPKLLSVGFAGIPEKPDAAFVWTGNDKTYFFKGDKYWLYDSTDPPVSEKYPLSISAWRGLPDDIDAAFQWGNHTYFFKDDKYYQFNDLSIEVDSDDPPYPRSTSSWLFDCQPIFDQIRTTSGT